MPLLLFAQSIYPLSFTFDDSDLYGNYIIVKNIPLSGNKSFPSLKVGLIDADDNSIGIDRHFATFPFCENIKTIDELYNYKTVYQDNLSSRCYYVAEYFMDNNSIKTISIDNIKVLIDEENGNKSYYANALIFKDNGQFLGRMSYQSFHQTDGNKFYSLLKTIKPNKNIKKIDEYIKEAQENIEVLRINRAFKNVVSAMFLDLKHKDIKPLLQKIYEAQMYFSLNETIKELELMQENKTSGK
jgi:hypothetical protein